MPEKFIALSVIGAFVAADVAQNCVLESIRFTLEPEPNDHYAITVRDEAPIVARVKKLIASATARTSDLDEQRARLEGVALAIGPEDGPDAYHMETCANALADALAAVNVLLPDKQQHAVQELLEIWQGIPAVEG